MPPLAASHCEPLEAAKQSPVSTPHIRLGILSAEAGDCFGRAASSSAGRRHSLAMTIGKRAGFVTLALPFRVGFRILCTSPLPNPLRPFAPFASLRVTSLCLGLLCVFTASPRLPALECGSLTATLHICPSLNLLGEG